MIEESVRFDCRSCHGLIVLAAPRLILLGLPGTGGHIMRGDVALVIP